MFSRAYEIEAGNCISVGNPLATTRVDFEPKIGLQLTSRRRALLRWTRRFEAIVQPERAGEVVNLR